MDLDGKDLYTVGMIQKIVNFDWTKFHHNQYTSFFDDAVTIINGDEDVVKELNKRQEDFKRKYGMTLAQAETKVFKAITGGQYKKMILRPRPGLTTYGERDFNDGRSVEVNWMDMMEDLRMMSVWVRNQVKEVAKGLGMIDF